MALKARGRSLSGLWPEKVYSAVLMANGGVCQCHRLIRVASDFLTEPSTAKSKLHLSALH